MTGVLRLWRRPTGPIVVVAAAKLILHLATNGILGFQRDELYYIASGRHLALGYVDYPPVAPLLARLDTTLFGISPWTLRLFPALVGTALVLLTGLCALEMGASRWTAVAAAVMALACPLLLGANWLFQTVTFDQLTWLLAVYLLLRLIRTGDRRLFVLIGVVLGIGLQTKFTIVALCIGLVVGVIATPALRACLRTRWPWIGLAIAVAIALPNLAWQVANHLPSLTYTTNHAADISQSGGLGAFVGQFLLYIGPVVLPLWVAGLVLLVRDARLRAVGVATVVAIALLLPEGKAYYPGPTIPLVLAAGCVAVGRMASATARRRLLIAVVAALVESTLVIRLALPVTPQASLHAAGLDAARQDYADTVGWPELTAQVGRVYGALPPDVRSSAAILAQNYGEAGAIDVYGPALGLPQALSPHLSFWYWKPAHVGATTLVTVGYAPADLGFLCGAITQAGTVAIPDSVVNQEQGAPILVCTNLRESLDRAWPAMREFS